MDNRNTGDLHNSGNVGPDQDTIAGATGGTGGAVAGAALGSIVGPIGTIIGGLAGAVGGWWAGKHISDSAAFNQEDDDFYQTHHTSNYSATSTADSDRSTGSRPAYNDVRPAYQLGHLAGVNPDYQSRSFDEVEPHLSSAYSTAGQNDWTNVRQYAQDAWSRGRQVGSQRFGSTGADRTSFDGSSVNSGSALGDHGRDLRTGSSGLADKVSDALDDFKDRVDGNPASHPGRDSTDRPNR
ncbi:MAG TPA: glycine zipper domain-containing protein [Gemmatimonas sp.]|nr:glycine zipper domain-containing protein [Gemmatimonas sp.]